MKVLNLAITFLILLGSLKLRAQQAFTITTLQKLTTMEYNQIKATVLAHSFNLYLEDPDFAGYQSYFLQVGKPLNEDDSLLKRDFTYFEYVELGWLYRQITYVSNNREEYDKMMIWIEANGYKKLEDEGQYGVKHSDGKKSFFLKDMAGNDTGGKKSLFEISIFWDTKLSNRYVW